MARTILIVDDDALLRRSLSIQLEEAGYRAQTVASAEAALTMVAADPPDLILLDVGLPGIDGLEALRRFQQQQDIPVIFVTARRREIDTILGLELGADSYITKPFNPDVLLAHIRAVLRRSERQAAAAPAPVAITVGDLQIDPAAHSVRVAGRPVELTAREFALLLALARHPGQVLSVDELIQQVWGDGFAGESQVVYVHIRWLREKIENDPQHPRRIVNVRGVGYKLLKQEHPL